MYLSLHLHSSPFQIRLLQRIHRTFFLLLSPRNDSASRRPNCSLDKFHRKQGKRVYNSGLNNMFSLFYLFVSICLKGLVFYLFKSFKQSCHFNFPSIVTESYLMNHIPSVIGNFLLDQVL